MALGAKGMKSVVSNSPVLARVAPEFSAAASLGAIDVVAVRLWLDRFVQVEHPANVFSRFEELRGAGGTFFMLDQLQDGSLEELWAGDEGCTLLSWATASALADRSGVAAPSLSTNA